MKPFQTSSPFPPSLSNLNLSVLVSPTTLRDRRTLSLSFPRLSLLSVPVPGSGQDDRPVDEKRFGVKGVGAFRSSYCVSGKEDSTPSYGTLLRPRPFRMTSGPGLDCPPGDAKDVCGRWGWTGRGTVPDPRRVWSSLVSSALHSRGFRDVFRVGG